VAVAAMISPKETFIYYQELLEYISKKIDYHLQLIQRKTYGEINELLSKGEIDLAFICSGPYATRKELYGFEALAVPVIRGKPFYQSYLIVNKKNPYNKLEDLRGRVFAFTDPESNTGALVPKYWLALIKETPDSFFHEITYTYSHNNSILAVAKNLVDAASVDGHIWEFYSRNNPTYTEETHVIKKSRSFGSPPLVASRYLSEKLKLNISTLIQTMHTDPQGIRILNKLMIDRFVTPEEEWYQPVKKMYQHLSLTGK